MYKRQEGIFIEQLETNPGQYIPEALRMTSSEAVSIDLNRPMQEVLAELSKYPVTTRLSLNGTIIVARDIAHEMCIRDRPNPTPQNSAMAERRRKAAPSG